MLICQVVSENFNVFTYKSNNLRQKQDIMYKNITQARQSDTANPDVPDKKYRKNTLAYAFPAFRYTGTAG